MFRYSDRTLILLINLSHLDIGISPIYIISGVICGAKFYLDDYTVLTKEKEPLLFEIVQSARDNEELCKRLMMYAKELDN